MIVVMVLLGGVTRLTGSGLSMVEWKPLFGVLPPVSEQAWQETFDKYKQFPQYQQVNRWMQLSDFKRIYFWEYAHRLWGRLIGVAFLLPFALLVATGRLRGRWIARTGAAFCLGGLQAVVGWLMVKSGLVDIPAVSHFRLALHLGLAFFVGQYIYWLILDLQTGFETVQPAPPQTRRLHAAVLVLLVVQVVYGAFMAGTRAGYLFPSFPTMNGHWWPPGFWAHSGFWGSLLSGHVAIHVIHRYMGLVLAVVVGAYWFWAQGRLLDKCAARRLNALVLLVGVQLVLGILTVVTQVGVAWALLHQLTAFFLLSAWVALAHRLRALRAPATIALSG